MPCTGCQRSKQCRAYMTMHSLAFALALVGRQGPAASLLAAIEQLYKQILGMQNRHFKSKFPILCWESDLRTALALVSSHFLQVEVDKAHLLLSHRCLPVTTESMKHVHRQQGSLKMTQGRLHCVLCLMRWSPGAGWNHGHRPEPKQ